MTATPEIILAVSYETNMQLPYDPAIAFLGIYFREMKTQK